MGRCALALLFGLGHFDLDLLVWAGTLMLLLLLLRLGDFEELLMLLLDVLAHCGQGSLLVFQNFDDSSMLGA